ncbi:MAG: class I SAM-dependent methyltransferase [Solirubrobacterales bacterium]
MNEPRDAAVVVDVGGGKRCDFAGLRAPGRDIRIVAVDIAPEQLEHNDDVDEKRVADVTKGLPFGDEEADVIASRSVLEHLRDIEAFVMEANRVLKPGGYFIHLLPSKFSPVSIANQLLPNAAAKAILHFAIPGSRGKLGFPAFYDRCYPSAMERVLVGNGLEVEAMHLGFHQRDYFDFAFPLFAVNSLYELIVFSLGLRDLCAVMLIVARKPSAD